MLAGIRADQQAVDAAGAAKLAKVLAWCELHVTSDPDDAATFGDTPVRLGGAGCPWIREYTITELASALRLSLPAAGFVDAQVAHFAEKLGVAGVERLVEDAIARFMPDLAQREREAAADQRHFDIEAAQVHLTVRPVIDLNANHTTTGRFATALQREQVILRDVTLRHPTARGPHGGWTWTTSPPWADPDDTGPPGTAWSRPARPPGTTETHNLAALCRHHHRAKTFTSWTYQQVLPGVFLWQSPHGLHYLTTAGRTIELD